MRIELDMFSGRPNPVWELDASAERELLELESKLLPAGRPANEPPPLGYRGFTYGEARDSRRVFDGILIRSGQSYEDSGCRIERLLIASMPHPFKGLRDHVPGQLKG